MSTFCGIDLEIEVRKTKKIIFNFHIKFRQVWNPKCDEAKFCDTKVNQKTMMRLDSGGTATATASAQQGPPQQQAASAAMSMSAMSASASSDFMGNQLASYFSQLFEKNPQEQVLQG